jgi:phosphoribosylanthranilate isomerase
MTVIKICGITNVEDALAAVAAGADALGFNFYKPSPRYISPENARAIIKQLSPAVLTVGVFVNEQPESLKTIVDESGIQAVQLHGDESPEYCHNLAMDRYIIKTLAVSQNFDTQTVHAYKTAAIMLDTGDNNLRGGTGRVFDWSIARQVNQLVPNLFLAGGLSPENIAGAIEAVHPYAVDACSALEDSPGKKNYERMRSFIETARSK